MSGTSSKWFPDLSVDTPPAEAARTVLVARCATVREHLDDLAQKKDEPEPVHQVRVATRRLAAALAVFETWIDPTAGKRIKKAAKRIRREAGNARDRDVGLGLLRERIENATWLPPALAGQIIEYYEENRDEARRKLMRDLPKLTARFEKTAGDVIRDLRAGHLEFNVHAATLGALSAAVLDDKLNRLAAAAATDLSDADNVHQLRIAGKRLRYAMEVFAACYPPDFRDDLYRDVERLQGTLGDVNDLRHLYGALTELRSVLAAHRSRSEREDVKSLIDRFNAQLAHEWLERQREFAEDWQRSGSELMARLRRMLPAQPRAAGENDVPLAGADERSALTSSIAR